MSNRLSSENHMLYFVYLTSYIYFVYYLISTKEKYILPYFEYITNYVKHCYSFKVHIFYRDRETVVNKGGSFITFIIEKGLIIKYSPLYT